MSVEDLISISKGLLPGHSLVHKYGRNPTVPNGSWELISNRSTTPVFLSSPTTVRIKAGNANDTAAGTGARAVAIEGLDSNLNRMSEIVATAGATASSNTTASFWRVDRAYVTACGDYSSPYNVADIVVENSAGTQDLILIAAEESQTQYCFYTVPNKVTATLLSVDITVDAALSADVRLLTRSDITTTSAPVSARRLRHFWDGVLGIATYRPRSPDLSLAGPGDIWLEAEGAGGGTSVSASFELLLSPHSRSVS